MAIVKTQAPAEFLACSFRSSIGKTLEEIPAAARESLRFEFLETVDQAWTLC
jgi:hypothetical protein